MLVKFLKSEERSKQDSDIDPESDDYYDDGGVVVSGEEGTEDYVHSAEVTMMALQYIHRQVASHSFLYIAHIQHCEDEVKFPFVPSQNVCFCSNTCSTVRLNS